jgi:predicted nucleic acid-binding protein
MIAAFILDCSMAMTWLFEDEASAPSTALLDRLRSESAVVPALWFVEIANVLAFAERKARITPDDSAGFIADIDNFNLEIDTEATERAFSDILPLCRAHQLTSYDAVYLNLAVRRQLPLATLDEPLRKAAKKLGVKLLGK